MHYHYSLHLLIHSTVQSMLLLSIKADKTRRGDGKLVLQRELKTGKTIICPLFAPSEIVELIGELSI